MRYFKINLLGDGAKVIQGTITEEQYTTLKDMEETALIQWISDNSATFGSWESKNDMIDLDGLHTRSAYTSVEVNSEGVAIGEESKVFSFCTVNHDTFYPINEFEYDEAGETTDTPRSAEDILAQSTPILLYRHNMTGTWGSITIQIADDTDFNPNRLLTICRTTNYLNEETGQVIDQVIYNRQLCTIDSSTKAVNSSEYRALVGRDDNQIRAGEQITTVDDPFMISIFDDLDAAE